MEDLSKPMKFNKDDLATIKGYTLKRRHPIGERKLVKGKTVKVRKYINQWGDLFLYPWGYNDIILDEYLRHATKEEEVKYHLDKL